MDDFYAARVGTFPPLPWPIFAPPFISSRRPPLEEIIGISMDTSKHVFQLHGVNAAEQPVLRRKLRRKEMVAFFEKCPPTVIAIEVCGASHHWARLLAPFGHEVKLIAPQLAMDGWLNANDGPYDPRPVIAS